MAKMLEFAPAPPEHAGKQMHRIENEMAERADAVKAAIDLLEVAHDKQVLDLVRGAMGARSTIFSTLADLGSKPESINAMRNLLELAKALGSIDPELVSKASANIGATVANRKQMELVPSLPRLVKRANQPDVRRGLSFLMEIAGALGRAVD